MTIAIIFGVCLVLASPIGIVAGPPIARFLRARRLKLQEARREREERDRLEKEKAAAFLPGQRCYFERQGIRTVDAKMSPRLSDVGTLHVTHSKSTSWQSDDDGSWHSQPILCDHGCGTRIVFLDEVAPVGKDGKGAAWERVGNYCASCGAWNGGASKQQQGPLNRLKSGVTNIFDAMGDPKDAASDDEWRRLEDEQKALEARLNVVRSRRLALAEQLGKTIDGGPFRPRLVEKTGT